MKRCEKGSVSRLYSEWLSDVHCWAYIASDKKSTAPKKTSIFHICILFFICRVVFLVYKCFKRSLISCKYSFFVLLAFIMRQLFVEREGQNGNFNFAPLLIYSPGCCLMIQVLGDEYYCWSFSRISTRRIFPLMVWGVHRRTR